MWINMIASDYGITLGFKVSPASENPGLKAFL